MTCPSCRAETPLTWGRYFSAPIGHECPQCRARFRFPLTQQRFLMLAGIGLAAALVPGLAAYFLSGSIWNAILVGWLGSLAGIIPLDRWLDDHHGKGQLISEGKPGE